MAQANFSLVGNRARNAEGLQSFTEGSGNFRGLGLSFFDGNGCT